MSEILKNASIVELVAYNESANIICDKYKNLYEMSRGNRYGDSEESKEVLKSTLEKLNAAEAKKNRIFNEIENRLENV